MSIADYINSNPKFEGLNFRTVYETILALIGDGILSMDDLVRK